MVVRRFGWVDAAGCDCDPEPAVAVAVEVVVLVCGAPADDPSAVTGPAAAISMLSRW